MGALSLLAGRIVRRSHQMFALWTMEFDGHCESTPPDFGMAVRDQIPRRDDYIPR
jgi:hypothetical protein